MQTHYEVLGVFPCATAEEMKAVYYEAMRRNHPDLGGDAEKVTLINEAYKILGDAKTRADYDNYLKLMFKRCVMCGGEGVRWTQKGFFHRDKVRCIDCSGRGYE
jgi:DnaJ-class molecular chaperone